MRLEPYDQREAAAADEDLRQRRADEADEAFNERRLIGDDDEEMTVGLDCCPHFVPYGSDCYQCDDADADYEIGLALPRRSPADDLTHNESRGE